MQDLLFAYLDMNCVLPVDHRDGLREIHELINEFNLEMGSNLDPIHNGMEYLRHVHQHTG